MAKIDVTAEINGRNGQTYGELMESLVMSDTDNDPNSSEGMSIQRAMLCFAESCLDSKSKHDTKEPEEPMDEDKSLRLFLGGNEA